MIAVRYWLTLFLFFLALPTSLHSQEQPATAQNRYLQSKPTYEVFVLGDALAFGLQAGLSRVTEDNNRFSINGRFKEDSGLARPEIYDWNDAIPKIFSSNEIDIAVLMIGMNDVQTIKGGNFRHGFGSPEWSSAYSVHVDRLIDTLKQTGAVIYWVGLPPMASEEYNNAIATIEAIQKERVAGAGVRFVDVRSVFSDEAGRYVDRGDDGTGEVRRLRDRDGIRFMKVGNNKLASLVLAAIEKDVAGAPPPVAQTPIAGNIPSKEAPGTGPAFGQEATEGVAGVVQPPATAAPSSPMTGKPVGAGSVATASTLNRSALAKGTAAYDLFVTGLPPKPNVGRFDDFSYRETP